jgi:hypothetical protein
MGGGNARNKWSDRTLVLCSVLSFLFGAWFVWLAIRNRAEWELSAAWVLGAGLWFFAAWRDGGEVWDRRKQRPH